MYLYASKKSLFMHQLPEKKWILRQAEPEAVESLYQSLKINKSICNILVQRGITDYDEAKAFFRPQLNSLHDPFLMKDMEKAVERIKHAIELNEPILIYGDYDVDGTTSVAMTYAFLKAFYPHVDFYIPNRYSEGYGISDKGVDFAAENGFKLVIALDCGIKAVSKIQRAKKLGVDFIVCDHHLPGEELPPATAILDPKQKDCPYPYKELSGCGVGFKLICALKEKLDDNLPNPFQYLDLVAVSIGCDIVPVTGENRILAFYGLKQVNESPSPGVNAILRSGGVKSPVSIMDLVFFVGPRINAAGRIDDAKSAVETLLANDNNTANKRAFKLNNQNTLRKDFDKSITEEATNILLEDEFFPEKKTTVVFHPEWHKGVIGIVASRLVERFYKPTIVLTESKGMVTGSARSIKGFNIYEALKSCSQWLEQFGGHFYAAGMTLKRENLSAFMEAFEHVVASSILDELLVPTIEIDTEVKFEQINGSYLNIINQLGPFGPGNMRPVFLSCGLQFYGNSRIVGDNHLKAAFSMPEQHPIQAIGFGLGQKLDVLKQQQKLDLCFCLGENEWQGIKSIQLELKDLKNSQKLAWNLEQKI